MSLWQIGKNHSVRQERKDLLCLAFLSLCECIQIVFLIHMLQLYSCRNHNQFLIIKYEFSRPFFISGALFYKLLMEAFIFIFEMLFVLFLAFLILEKKILFLKFAVGIMALIHRSAVIAGRTVTTGHEILPMTYLLQSRGEGRIFWI